MGITIADFEGGLDEIIQTVLRQQKRPCLVAIHGAPDSGKTTLKLRAARALEKRGMLGWAGKGEDAPEKIGKRTIKRPAYILVEDLEYTASTNLYTREVFGRTADLRVYITDRLNLAELPPALREDIKRGVYNLIVENQYAKRKGTLFAASHSTL